MRTLLPTLLLLALIAPTPGLAQAEGPAPLLADPAGDVRVLAGDSVVPAGGMDAIDLVALDLREDPAGFTVDVQVAGLGSDGARADFGSVQVRFDFGGAWFIVNFARSEDNAAYFGNLVRGVDGDWAIVRGLPVERDLSSGHLWTSFDRADVTGADGQQPGRGDQFTDLRVGSAAAVGYLAQPANLVGIGPWVPVEVGDDMPDAGAPHATYTVRFGGGAGEGATLTVDQAFKSSNGEATTYLYTLTATNGGEATRRFALSLEGLPADWNATLPGKLLELPAGQPVTFPLYVTTTFRHAHGTAATFQVHLHEVDGARWAMAELGIDYLAVPQPAGHHPDLWFHTSYFGNAVGKANEALGGSNGYATMNTLEEDPADTAVPVAGYSGAGGQQATFHWSVCLEPSLLLGLDFDLAGTGSLEVPFSTTRPLPGAVLSGRLLRLGPGEPMASCFPSVYADRDATVLADLAGTPQDIGANGQGTLKATLAPTPESDYIAAEKGAALVLELTLTADTPGIWGSGGALLLPGAHMQLPLNEYHDAVQVVVPDAAEPAPGFVPEGAAAKDSPGLALPLLAAAVVGLAALLRRRA